MGIDPEHAKLSFRALVEIGQGRLADQAVAAKGEDAIRPVLLQDFCGSLSLGSQGRSEEDAAFFGRVHALMPGRHGHFNGQSLAFRGQKGQQAGAEGIDLTESNSPAHAPFVRVG